MIRRVDSDSNGCIDFEEFLTLMASQHHDPDEELRRVFQMIDIDNSGSISSAELKCLMVKLGQNVSDAEIHQMMRVADENNDDFVSFEEFKMMMNS